jgi:hypothetical protein
MGAFLLAAGQAGLLLATRSVDSMSFGLWQENESFSVSIKKCDVAGHPGQRLFPPWAHDVAGMETPCQAWRGRFGANRGSIARRETGVLTDPIDPALQGAPGAAICRPAERSHSRY